MAAVPLRPLPRRVGLLAGLPDPPDELLVDQVGAAAAVLGPASVSVPAAAGASPHVSQ
ncbi:hypothetical protein GCM10009608_04830 [Pseudonocardia alaniniphila]